METKRRINKKSSPPKLKDLDAQQRRLALLKQKQCDKIALDIVIKSIQGPLDEDVFLLSLKYLNQCHFDDIVEERAISKLCGYPICGNLIPDMPRKQFHISTKTNKIYDITDRKHFCSNFCYNAGCYIKKQMLTSPLWFRDKEEIPNFHLLSKTKETDIGSPGVEVDQGFAKIDIKKKQKFTSVSQFTQNVIEEISNKVDLKEKQNNEPDYLSIFMPNLADILKENATYFQHEINEETINTSLNKNSRRLQEKHQLNKDILKNSCNDNKIKDYPVLKEDYTSQPQKVIGLTFSEEKQKTQNEDNNLEIITTENKKGNKNKFNNVEEIHSEHKKEKTNEITLEEKKENNNIKETEANDQKITKDTKIKKKGILKKIEKRSSKTVSFAEKDEVKEIEKVDQKPYIIQHVDLIGSVQEKPTNYNLLQNEVNLQSTMKEEKSNRIKNSSCYKRAKMIGAKQQNISIPELKLRINCCLEEWITLDTIIFLFGKEEVKKIISEKKFKQHFNKKKNLEEDSLKRKQYEAICKTLNIIEMADQKFDDSVIGNAKREPLPRFEELKKQAETMNLRVQAFYSGCYEVYEEDTDSEIEQEDEPYIVKAPPPVYPLIDSIDIQATRKKIFLTSLSRAITEICEILKQCPNELLSELNQLINTFEFTAKNIVFRSHEWKFVALLLIKILSLRNEELNKCLGLSEVSVYIQSFEKSLNVQLPYNQLNIFNLSQMCVIKQS